MLTSIFRAGALLVLAIAAKQKEIKDSDAVTLLQRFHDTVAQADHAVDMDAMEARMAAMEAHMEAMEAQMEGGMAAMSSVDGHGAEGWFKRLKKRLKHGYGDSDDGRTPVIVDTDVDTDDQMAIAYLLAQPDFKVLAITVGCNGWSQQWAGVMSIMRLTKYFGQPDIPVAFSYRYNPDTQLNLNEPNGLPDPTLLEGKGNFLSEFVGLPFNIRPPSWMYTGQLLKQTLSKSRKPVDILALGPLTNLAHFLQESPKLFELKVKRIYNSGGTVVSRDSDPTDKVWPYSAPDTSFTGNPPDTEWNIFSDPVAANSVLSFGVSIVLATSTYTEGMQFYLNDTDFIPSSCDSDRADVLTKMVTTLPTTDGEDPDDLRYWDESAMVLFVQMLRNGGKAEAAVCEEWDTKRFAVMLEAGNNASVSGGQYSRLLQNEFGQEATECLTGNLTEFKIAYFEGFCSR